MLNNMMFLFGLGGVTTIFGPSAAARTGLGDESSGHINVKSIKNLANVIIESVIIGSATLKEM